MFLKRLIYRRTFSLRTNTEKVKKNKDARDRA